MAVTEDNLFDRGHGQAQLLRIVLERKALSCIEEQMLPVCLDKKADPMFRQQTGPPAVFSTNWVKVNWAIMILVGSLPATGSNRYPNQVSASCVGFGNPASLHSMRTGPWGNISYR